MKTSISICIPYLKPEIIKNRTTEGRIVKKMGDRHE